MRDTWKYISSRPLSDDLCTGFMPGGASNTRSCYVGSEQTKRGQVGPLGDIASDSTVGSSSDSSPRTMSTETSTPGGPDAGTPRCLTQITRRI